MKIKPTELRPIIVRLLSNVRSVKKRVAAYYVRIIDEQPE